MIPLRQGQLARVLCLFSTYKKMQNKELGRTDHVDYKLRFYILSSNVVFLICHKKECNYEGLK